MNVPADVRARELLRDVGPLGAWHRATSEAIDAHLAGDCPARDYWRAVQGVLGLIAPRPGMGDMDVYRTAKLLIAQHGADQAWRIAMDRATEDESLAQQTTMLRIADAVHAMSPGGPEESRTNF